MSKKIYSASELNINHLMLDKDAYLVISELQRNHFHAYVVGGGVRDLLLNVKPKDFDIVTNATPEQVRRIFGRNSMIIGRRFKIVHVYFRRINQQRSDKFDKDIFERHVLEVSTFRSNKVYDDSLSQHGRILVDNNYGSMDEDAFRRDFTVNALYYDPIAEKIIDYHNGIADIKNRILRIIGKPQERYIEDPVRILRAIRLSEKLALTIDDNTCIPFRSTKHLLANEPRGRLFEEMIKILMSGSSKKVISELHELKLPRKVFPLLDQLFFHAQDDFALRVLERTDDRVSGGEQVSLIFIFAALAWQAVYQSWTEQLALFGGSRKQALLDAIAQNKHLLINNGVTQNMYSAIREIWLSQLEFEQPNLRDFERLITSSRFRQGWHLFTLRNEFGQIDKNMFMWWDKFVSAEGEDKTELLIELVDMIPHHEPEKKRKRRKKRKNKHKHSHDKFQEQN
ncbi:MAG: polynucleotide adenylyltransferase PcnB [Proteobacteria bacterium]|nr:MAG: polynucleotide adenylyltransferase PcnB [Pseudomonadota bacterium]